MISKTTREAEQRFFASATSEFNNTLMALLRSKQPLVYISTIEESRLLAHLESLCKSRKDEGYVWDCFKGLRKLGGDQKPIAVSGVDFRNPELTLNHIITMFETERTRRRELQAKDPSKRPITDPALIFILLDFYRYFPPQPAIQRRLKYISSEFNLGNVIMTGPFYIRDQSLDSDIAVLDFPYPNEFEIGEIFDETVSIALRRGKFPNLEQFAKDNREKIIDAVKGLTLAEAENAYCKSVVMANDLGHHPFDVDVLIKEKQSIIRKTDILEWVEPAFDLSDVGGLDNLTGWLSDRKLAFSHEAQAYGLRMPRGVMLLGVPGGGKSLTAKAVAKDYGKPLLRLDFGRMFDSLVGESEKTVRAAIKMSETIAPCISGTSIIYDTQGRAYTIEQLMEDRLKFESENMFVYAFNENINRTEKTQVKSIIKHAKKKEMIRITTSHSSVEVTNDHKVMINRDGKLKWVDASTISKGDLVMAPKFFQRHRAPCEWKQAITVPYETFEANGATPYSLVGKFGEENHIIHLPTGFNTSLLYYLVGMIDGAGWNDSKNGILHFGNDDWFAILSYSVTMADLFMIEPEISGDKKTDYYADVTNRIVSNIMTYALEHLFQQNDEIIAQYLSGFLDASGRVVDYLKSPSLHFSISDPIKKERIKKSLHVFGILAPKEGRNSLSIDSLSDIEALSACLDCRINHLLMGISLILEKDVGKENRNIGFRLGSALAEERITLGLDKSDFGISPGLISRYEKDTAVTFDQARRIAEVLQSRISPGSTSVTKNSVLELICSGLIGIKVVKTEKIGEQWAYDLACEKNHNFFANDVLCHNCVLWVDEIDKALSGGVGAGSGDSGTTKRVLSTFLTWLQEKTKPVFVVATANNVLDIPPEFMRAGRFDEVFFVDLPGPIGRRQIFEIHLRRHGEGLGHQSFNLNNLIAATKGFSGAEIEKCIESAMFEAFKDGKRPISTEDILKAINQTKSLAQTRSDEINAMRTWASGRCTIANTDSEIE